MTPGIINRFIHPLAVSALLLAGCGSGEKALLEIDFTGAEEWKYLLGADIYGVSEGEGNFSGSLRAYLQGIPGESGPSKARFGLKDVTFNAPFFPESEREDIYRRLTELEVSVSESSISLSDTIGIPGVFSGGWDIMRCVTRVMPVMPNAEIRVGTSWEREQRFPLTVEQGQAYGLLYQFFTLDSLYKTPSGTPAAAFSWLFAYRVSLLNDNNVGAKKHPLSGSGRGNAALDLNRKKLIMSKAAFEVTHSQKSSTELNEIVHFEMVE